MSLIINQGKQDTSAEKSFEIMTSPNEVLQITKIENNKDWDNTLDITFKVISEGKYKNRMCWDRITYDPKSNFAWKYLSLRRAAGCPYTEGENTKIDIEALLLNKAVTVELLARKGNDGNDYQSIKYKAAKVKESTEEVKEETAEVEDTVEDENPFETDLSTDTDMEW